MGLLNIFKKKEEPKKKEVNPPIGGEEKKTGKKAGKEPYFAPLESVKSGKEKEPESIKKTDTAKTQQKKVVSEIVYPVRDYKNKEKTQRKQISSEAYRVLSSPHITEKATDLSEKNKYVFKVKSRTNKVEIKKVIKDTYGVDAVDVKIINVHRKKRRLGKQTGWRKGYKKAIVKVKEGQKIEILSR